MLYIIHICIYSGVYIYTNYYYYFIIIVTTMFILIMFIGIPIKPIVGICMYIVYVLAHSLCLSNTPIVWSHVARNLSKPWAIVWRSSKAMKRMGWDESDDMNGIPHSICWLVVWNMNFIFPDIGNSNSNCLSYFSEGLKRPTRYVYIYITGMNRYQYTVTWISSTGLLYITGLFCFFCWVCHVSSAEGDDAEAFVFWPQRAVPFPRLKITAWRWLDSTPKDCHAF